MVFPSTKSGRDLLGGRTLTGLLTPSTPERKKDLRPVPGGDGRVALLPTRTACPLITRSSVPESGEQDLLKK